MSSDKQLSPWENPVNWKDGVFTGYEAQAQWEKRLLKETKLALEAKEAEAAAKRDLKVEQDEKMRAEIRRRVPEIREMRKMLKAGVVLGIDTGSSNWVYLLGGNLACVTTEAHLFSFPVVSMVDDAFKYRMSGSESILNDMLRGAPDFHEVKFGLQHDFRKVFARRMTPEDVPNIPEFVLDKIARLEKVK